MFKVRARFLSSCSQAGHLTSFALTSSSWIRTPAPDPRRITAGWESRCGSALEILTAPCKEEELFYPGDYLELFKYMIGFRLERMT